MKQEYNSNITLGKEIILLVALNKTIYIRHCSVCDTIDNKDIFLEWLMFIETSTEIKIQSDDPYLELKHITSNLNCVTCNKQSIIQVIFEWVFNDDTKNKT